MVEASALSQLSQPEAWPVWIVARQLQDNGRPAAELQQTWRLNKSGVEPGEAGIASCVGPGTHQSSNGWMRAFGDPKWGQPQMGVCEIAVPCDRHRLHAFLTQERGVLHALHSLSTRGSN